MAKRVALAPFYGVVPGERVLVCAISLSSATVATSTVRCRADTQVDSRSSCFAYVRTKVRAGFFLIETIEIIQDIDNFLFILYARGGKLGK